MTPVDTWVGRIEAALDDPVELEDLRSKIEADKGLTDNERDTLDARIATYLADLDREAGPLDAYA